MRLERNSKPVRPPSQQRLSSETPQLPVLWNKGHVFSHHWASSTSMCSKTSQLPVLWSYRHPCCDHWTSRQGLPEKALAISCDKCDWKGIRDRLDDHRNNDCPQRPFECRYCGEKGTYKTISGPHNAVCKKKPVPCPNNECDSKIQRLGIKRHLENCVYEEIPCKYAKLGCGTKVKRKDAPRHEADASNHHELSLQTTLHLQDIVNKLNITCSPVTFALSGYVRRRTHDHVVVSPSFYTSRRGYNMAVEIHTKNGEIEAFVQMKPGLHDSKLKWPFTGKVTIELLNQLEDQNHIKLKESTERINQRGQTRLLINYCLPQDAINTCLKDDTLFFKVTVEAFSHKSWLECTENNGN